MYPQLSSSVCCFSLLTMLQLPIRYAAMWLNWRCCSYRSNASWPSLSIPSGLWDSARLSHRFLSVTVGENFESICLKGEQEIMGPQPISVPWKFRKTNTTRCTGKKKGQKAKEPSNRKNALSVFANSVSPVSPESGTHSTQVKEVALISTPQPRAYELLYIRVLGPWPSNLWVFVRVSLNALWSVSSSYSNVHSVSSTPFSVFECRKHKQHLIECRKHKQHLLFSYIAIHHCLLQAYVCMFFFHKNNDRDTKC